MMEEPPLAQYSGDESFFGGDAPLPLSAGYAIVLGFGAFFMLFTTLLVWIDQKYNKTKITSEQFNTAGRSVPIGLTASVIVSQWTWAATLLQSSNVAFAYGVSGPFWYASGATIQVLLFGILAIELKRKAPTCHTVCEMVNVRWGKTAHITFLIFCFMANVIVTSMLLLGGAATVNALTGMNIALASFLIPWGVILYTVAGGLKATFMASYVHTAIIFLILVTFVFTVYVKEFSSDIIYDWLAKTVSYSSSECEAIFSDENGVSFFLDKDGKNSEGYACGSVPDNNGGSYLTMLSWGGLQFGIINIVGNFGTVFVDQSYWQSAIAAKPSAAHKGYLLGGLCWFTIPFTLATSMGLSALALQLPITAGEAGAGLVPPAVAVHLFGNLGGYMIAIMLFMAIVSTGSAESIAVSSLVAYDIYRQYINPEATGQDILRVSRWTILLWGLGMGVFSIILHEIGLNLGWVYQFMGIAIGSAVYPLWSLLTNTRTNAIGAVAGAWGGMLLAFVCWISTCAGQNDGEVTVATLASKQAFLVGNIVALAASALICEIASIISPQNYDWALLDAGITMIEDDRSGLSPEDLDPEELLVAKKWIETRGWVMTIILIIIWPILSIPAGVFTKSYFAFWIFVAVCWGFAATLVIIVMPLYESRESLHAILCGMMGFDAPAGKDTMDESRDGAKNGGEKFWKKEQPAKT